MDLSKHPQSGGLSTSFSTWGTENSLEEINLESTEVIKFCNIFWVKIGKHLQFCGLEYYRATRNSLVSRMQLDELNELQVAIHYTFIKFCIYCFSLWYEFFVHYVKIINMLLMRELWKFSFFGRGDVLPTHSEICLFVSAS